MFFAALDKPHKNARVTRSALALTMRTALRSRELRGGRWSEVAGADWIVPADRMKVRETHVVPCRRVMSLVVGEERRPLQKSEPDEGGPAGSLTFGVSVRRARFSAGEAFRRHAPACDERVRSSV